MQKLNFPDNLLEFEKMFSSEKQCREHFFNVKYPNGFVCSKCGCSDYWWTSRELMHCKNCEHQESLKAQTIMEGSKKSLKIWYRAFYLVSFQKSGINAKNLQNQLGFGSYQTAWTWLHKIRRCLRRTKREDLKYNVEVDETIFGGASEGKRGRGAANKQLLAIGVEKTGKILGRIRIEEIKNASGDALKKFIENNIEKGSKIKTDGWKSYVEICKNNYEHIVVKKKENDNPLPAIHLIASQLKRWTLGLHQGLVKGKNIQYYLDEFVFRFNRRKSKSRGKVFYRVLEQVVSYKATPYWKIIGRSFPNIAIAKTT